MNPVDIFICAYKRPKMTMETIRYLKERTKTPYRLFLIHNGGNEEALIEHVDDFFLVIDPNYNIGIHAAWNISLALASSDYFVTIDNDILVPDLEPDWLSQLTGLMDNHPDFGAIALQPHKFIGLDKEQCEDDGEILYTPMVGAVARIMRRDVIWKVGGWEKIVRSSRNHEEKVICAKIHDVGYKFGYTSKLYAFHLWGTQDETDYWGYDKNATPESHGHRDIWPPPWIFSNKEDYDNKTWIKKE